MTAFPRAPGTSGDDFLTFAGATRLACLIEAYWAKEGHSVTCQVVSLTAEIRADDNITAREAIYRNWAVRSDLVDGLPPRSQPVLTNGEQPSKTDAAGPAEPQPRVISVPPLPEARPRLQHPGSAPENVVTQARPRLRRPGSAPESAAPLPTARPRLRRPSAVESVFSPPPSLERPRMVRLAP
jgi:hypothetical protein